MQTLLVRKWIMPSQSISLTLRSGKTNLAPYDLDFLRPVSRMKLVSGLHSCDVKSDLLLYQASGYPI